MTMKGKTILVTGAGGFTGSHLSKALVKQGANVVAYVKRGSPFTNLIDISNQIKIIKGDIQDYTNLLNVMKEVDYVFHVAAIVPVHESRELPYLSTQVNTVGTFNVAWAASQSGVKKLLYTSTCLPPSELIQTNPTLKKIENIEIDDKVFSHDGKYHFVLDKMSRYYDGLLYKIKPQNFLPFTVTAEHPIFIAERRKWKGKFKNKVGKIVWQKASKLKKGDYLLYPIPREIESKEKIFIDGMGEVKLTNMFLTLLGYYAAEGYSNGTRITFSFHEKEKEYVNDVIKAMQFCFGINKHRLIRSGKHGLKILFYSKPLCNWLLNNFGERAIEKKLPSWILNLSSRKQKYIILGIWRGDGTFAGKYIYYTSSRILANQIKNILLRQGIIPYLWVRKSHGMHKESYVIAVTDKESIIKMNKIFRIKIPYKQKSLKRSHILNGFLYLPIRKIEILPYRGLVYNLEVSDSNSYCTEGGSLHNCHIYGNQPESNLPINEEAPPNPLDIYSATKYAGEILLRQFVNIDGMDVIITRAFNKYGPNQVGDWLFPRTIKKVLTQSKITAGNPDSTRDYSYIEDAIQGYILAMEKGRNGDIFNLGSGKETSVKKIVEKIIRASGRKVSVDWETYRSVDIHRSFGNCSKAKKVLGWEPKISLDEGIRRTIEWWKQHPELLK